MYADSQGALIPKVDFEQRTEVLAWDVGYRPGYIDEGDLLTDLTQECPVGGANVFPPPEHMLSARERSTAHDLNLAVAQILKKFGMQASDFKMNAVVAGVGKPKEPLFLLFPAYQMNEPVKRELGELHQARALDILKLTTVLDGQGVVVVNSLEGPLGAWAPEYKLTPQILGDRIDAAYKLMSTRWVSGGNLIGEIYADKVFTQYSDRNDLAIQYALAVSAYEMSFEASPLDLGSRWDRAKAYVRERYPFRSTIVNLDSFRGFFEKIVSRSSDELRTLSSQICEVRGHEMARYSHDMAKRRGAGVVYMEFGAIHTHGIVEQLRKHSASYIVFSPNF